MIKVLNFLDTSAVLNGGLKLFENVYISPLVLTELEHIKDSANKSDKIKYLAREAVRDIITSTNISYSTISQKQINKNLKRYDFLSDINDHRLLCEALVLSEEQEVKFITSDSALLLFAQQFPQLKTLYLEEDAEPSLEEYSGWRKCYPTEEQLNSLYSNPEMNVLQANINEYCEIFEGSELKDILRWTGEKYVSLKWSDFTSVLGEKIRPRNLEQKMYLDLLQNKDIPVKMCIGHFGTGKSKLALDYALLELKNGHFDKIVFVKNNLEVKGAGILGTLPGDEISKQYPWLRQIEDHIGLQKFEEYLETDMIEPAHLSSLRGRDLRNACIIVDEAENLLDKNIQLLLGRVAEGSEIIFCADIKQCDYKDEKMSGIPKAIERLKNNKLFGLVKLIKTERSAVAALADYLD